MSSSCSAHISKQMLICAFFFHLSKCINSCSLCGFAHCRWRTHHISLRPTHHNIADNIIFRLRRVWTVPLPTAAGRLTSLVVLQVALDSRQTPLSWTLASPAQRTKTCTALAAERPTLERSLLAAPRRRSLRIHTHSASSQTLNKHFFFSPPKNLTVLFLPAHVVYFTTSKEALISSVSGRVSFQ